VVAGRSVENCKDGVTQFLARLKIAAGNVVGTAAPLFQAGSSFRTKAFQPFAHRALGYPELAGDGCGLLPADPFYSELMRSIG
jgi:hypothetical protein